MQLNFQCEFFQHVVRGIGEGDLDGFAFEMHRRAAEVLLGLRGTHHDGIGVRIDVLRILGGE